MKTLCLYIFLLSAICMGIFYIDAMVDLFLKKKFYEGYIFGLPIIMYDIFLIIPALVVLAKGSDEAKIWVIIQMFLNNLLIFLGFKIAAILGVSISIIAIFFFLVGKGRLLKKKNEL